jgi:hypothetical protein
LRRVINVGIVKKILYSKEDLQDVIKLSSRLWLVMVLEPTNLFDGDGRLPRLFFIQNGKADSARWVYVRVEERWRELA